MIALILTIGSAASLAFTILAFVSYKFAPEVWLYELSGGREDGGAPLKSVFFAVGFILILSGSACVAAILQAETPNSDFFSRFIAAWGVITFICIYDFIVIDVILYMWIKPGLMTFPGFPRLDSYTAHLRASLKGIFPIGLPMSATCTGMSYLLIGV